MVQALAKVAPVIQDVKDRVAQTAKKAKENVRSPEKVEGDAEDINGMLQEQAEGIAEKLFKGGGGEAMDG